MKAVLRFLFQTPMHYLFKRCRNPPVIITELGHVLLEDRVHQFDERIAMKCLASRQHFVKDHAETEYIGAVIDWSPANLLGRHIACRSHYSAGTRDRFARRVLRTGFITLGSAQLSKPKVEDLHPVVFGNKDVLGLQVAVDDSFFVRGRQTADDLLCVFDCFSQRDRHFIETLAKFLAFKQFRDDEWRAFVFADIVNAQNVWMIKSRGRFSLLLK